MKKFNLRKAIISILATSFLCSMSLFVACNSGGKNNGGGSQSELYNPNEEDNKQTLSIDAVKEVELGDTLTLAVRATNIDTEFIWSSSNESVATVNDSGEITTLSAGQTVITVRAGSLSSSCTLTVYQTASAPVITLDADDITIGVGSKYSVNVADVKWNNQEVQVSNLNWVYKDEPQEVVDKVVAITPSADGKTVEIEGLKIGEAELTVSCSYFNNLGAKTVKVKVVNLETIKIEGLEYVGNDTYSATTYTEVYTKTVGQTTYNYQESIAFNATIYKNGIEVQEQPQFTITDPSIAKIEDGKIIGLKEGETTIICSYNDTERRINFVCSRPVVDLTEQDHCIVDCYTSTNIDVLQADAIQGAVKTVSFSNNAGESYIDVGSYADGVITIDTEKLQTSQMGGGILKLSEDNIDYVFSCSIYTMVIDNAEKLNKLSEESKKMNSAADIFDGYFVLGADITLPESYAFNEVATGVEANGQNGFIGIFDGQGYQIDGLSIRNGGLFATMGANSVVKNTSFTNASVKDSGFISSSGAGSIQNLYIQYKEITATESCDGFVGTFFVNAVNGKASVSNCVVLTTDATYNSNDKSYKKIFVIGGTAKEEGVYSDILVTVKNAIKENYFTSHKGKNCKNSNDSYIVEQNKEAVAEKFTSFAKSWDRNYWELDAVSFPKPIGDLSVAEHSWGSLIAGENATCWNNGTSAYKECQHCSAIAICDDSGEIVGITTNENDLTILASHRLLAYENGTLKCKECATICQEFNLNVHDQGGSYVCDNNSIEIDFSALDLSSVASIKIGSKTINGYTVDDHKVTIPYSSFCISEGRYYFGNQTLSITYNDAKKIDLPILLKTKVLTSVNDLQDFGKIALAQSDNSEITNNTAYKYAGYFELGANIDCDGARYTMVANSSQHVSPDVNGFSGVFDGKGYTISNLLVGADKVWYNGWDDTPDTCYDTYSFFGRLDGGKICNINFTDVKLNPMSSLLCSSGYGEISNIFAQITRCAIITDIDSATGQVVAYYPLSLCFSNGVNGDVSKTSVHDVIVDYLDCAYMGLNKDKEHPYGSGLATYADYGFVDNAKIYNVFGQGASDYLADCYVVGYPGQAWNNETQFKTYADMNISTLGNFNENMFAVKGNMLLPISLANVYEGLTSIEGSIDKNIVLPGDTVKVYLGAAKPFATFITESDKISYANGYIQVADDAAGRISFRFALKLADGTTVETSDIVLGVYANDGEIFDAEVDSWESEDIGAVKVGSALNSSEVVEKFGSNNIYKTNGGYGQSIVNTTINAANYTELYFAFKTNQQVTLSNGNGDVNVITPNTWYFVKLEKQANGSWTISAKGLGDSEYTALTADEQFFGAGNATFNSMFRTYLWIQDRFENNHEVYATDVWGVEAQPHLDVEGLIDSLPDVITSADVDAVFTVYTAYQALSVENQAKVNADKVTKLNNALGQVFALETSTWAGANKVLDNTLNDTATKIGTFGSYDIYSKTGLGYGGSGIGSENIQINDYKEVYFMLKATYPVSIFSGDWYAPKLEVNTWYAFKLVKGAEHWSVYQREICADAWVELELDNYDSLKSTESVWFNSALITVTWDENVSYDVFASGLWCIGEEAYESVAALIDKLPDTITSADIDGVFTAYDAYQALSAEQQAKVDSDRVDKLNNSYAQVVDLEISAWENEGLTDTGFNALSNATSAGTWGELAISSVANTGYDVIANANVDSSLFNKLYFAFKADKQVNLSSGTANGLAPNTWYFVQLEKQEDGSWTISTKAFGDSSYISLEASSEFFGSGNATFGTMFRTYSWDGIAYNVYATNVWGATITDSEIAAWEAAGAEKLGSALNSSVALEEKLGSLAVYKTNGGYGQSIVNKSVDASNYSALYFAFKATQQVTLSNGDYTINVITPNMWYFVQLAKQADGSWTISAKKVGDSAYAAFTASTEFFGAGNATFETMFRTYLWTSDTYNHEVYATDVWGVSVVGGEIAAWETTGAVKLGSAINSSVALDEKLGSLAVYKTNGGYGQSIVNKSIDASNYTEFHFAFKATQQVNLSNGDYDKNVITPNTWYFVKLEKQADGNWTISVKKVGDSAYTAFTASTEFFGAGNATFETMFRTYLWIADAMENNHEVYATDVWGK